MLDWLIIGGGIHGTHIAHVLNQRGGVPLDRLRILDPNPRLLARWEECTGNTGMPFLRSPLVHHLGVHPFGLHDFSRTKRGKPVAKFTAPYDRPGTLLFKKHCDWLIENFGLFDSHLVGAATRFSEIEGGMRVETTIGAVEARRVILAIGMSDQPFYPEWAATARAAGAPVGHIFDAGFSRADLPDWTSAVVIGGGITAAQTAAAMGRRLPGTVSLLLPYEERIHQFDSDPGWLGPKEMRGFEAEKVPAKRRAMIREARHRGSMPPDVRSDLRRGVHAGEVHKKIARVASAEVLPDGGLDLKLDDGSAIRTDRVVLATGFEQKRPGGALIDRLIGDFELPIAPCGFPIPDAALRWHPRIFVTGPLGELELGPPARNIAGARRAADRLLKSV